MERWSVDRTSVLGMATTTHLDHEVPLEVQFLVAPTIQAIAATVATNVDTMRTIVTSTSPPGVTDLTQDRVHALVTTDAGPAVAVIAAVAPGNVVAVVVVLESALPWIRRTFMLISVHRGWIYDVMNMSC